MKRYAIFGYAYFYPTGGMNDFITSCNTVEEAEKVVDAIKSSEKAWVDDVYEVWDMKENKCAKIIEGEKIE